MGPDGVSTYSYGARISGTNCITSSSGYGFCGTSAAAPHVTGAAALLLSKLKQQYPSDTASQLRDRVRNSLTSSAITMGNGIPNNVYGYGHLQLPALYNINVTKTGTGSGTVTSNITGINCGSKCSDSFISGSTVTLTASPDTGSLFQWSGACSGTGSCPLTMNGDKAVTATFYLPILFVSKTGAGNGTITSLPAGVDCGATCSANYNAGTPVTLNVSPDTGSTFLGWSGGGCSGTGPCIVTMNDSASVSTSFGVNTSTCPNSVARIVGKANYTSLQNAYNAAADGDTIQNQAVTLNENVNANRNISVTIDGGYNCYYSSNPEKTTLKGALTINSGTVNIKNFNLQF